MDKHNRIRVAIADDNKLLAQSIREKLEIYEDELEYKYTAFNGRDLLERLKQDNDVDTILMDIEMPELDGIACTEYVDRHYPSIKIIMLTVFDDDDKIFRSIRAGANGYLLKEEPPDVIRDSIRMIMAGGAAMTPVIAAKSLALLRSTPNDVVKTAEAIQESNLLTKRQAEVLEQLSRGLDYKAIAENLFVSPFTVRKHIEHIYEKLQVHNKMQAVQKAQRHKLI